MTSMELIGLNTKWYRYQNNLTQEQYANKTKFKMAYIGVIETGNANLTCKNIDFIAKSFNIKPELLFNENTAKIAKKLPVRVDMYKKEINRQSFLPTFTKLFNVLIIHQMLVKCTFQLCYRNITTHKHIINLFIERNIQNKNQKQIKQVL